MEYRIIILLLTTTISSNVLSQMSVEPWLPYSTKCTGNSSFPDRNNCRKYYRCVKGTLTHFTCQGINDFSPVYNWCLPPRLAKCGRKKLLTTTTIIDCLLTTTPKLTESTVSPNTTAAITSISLSELTSSSPTISTVEPVTSNASSEAPLSSTNVPSGETTVLPSSESTGSVSSLSPNVWTSPSPTVSTVEPAKSSSSSETSLPTSSGRSEETTVLPFSESSSSVTSLSTNEWTSPSPTASSTVEPVTTNASSDGLLSSTNVPSGETTVLPSSESSSSITSLSPSEWTSPSPTVSSTVEPVTSNDSSQAPLSSTVVPSEETTVLPSSESSSPASSLSTHEWTSPSPTASSTVEPVTSNASSEESLSSTKETTVLPSSENGKLVFSLSPFEVTSPTPTVYSAVEPVTSNASSEAPKSTTSVPSEETTVLSSSENVTPVLITLSPFEVTSPSPTVRNTVKPVTSNASSEVPISTTIGPSEETTVLPYSESTSPVTSLSPNESASLSHNESTLEPSPEISTNKPSSTLLSVSGSVFSGLEPSSLAPTVYPHKLCEEGSSLPNELDCQKYYVCIGGKYIEQECQEYMEFSKTFLTCMPPLFARCSNNTTTVSPPETSTIVWTSAVATYTTLTSLSTSTINSFSTSQTKPQQSAEPLVVETTSASLSSTSKQPFTEVYCTENEKFPDPLSCRNYYVCVNNSLVLKTCPDVRGRIQEFNYMVRECLPAIIADCKRYTTEATVTPNPNAPSTGIICLSATDVHTTTSSMPINSTVNKTNETPTETVEITTQEVTSNTTKDTQTNEHTAHTAEHLYTLSVNVTQTREVTTEKVETTTEQATTVPPTFLTSISTDLPTFKPVLITLNIENITEASEVTTEEVETTSEVTTEKVQTTKVVTTEAAKQIFTEDSDVSISTQENDEFSSPDSSSFTDYLDVTKEFRRPTPDSSTEDSIATSDENSEKRASEEHVVDNLSTKSLTTSRTEHPKFTYKPHTVKPHISLINSYLCDEYVLYPNPRDCQQFYQCSQGALAAMFCPIGEEFSEADQKCLPTDLAGCSYVSVIASDVDESERIAHEEIVEAPNQIIPNTNDCTSYFICHGTMCVEIDCADGQEFSITERTCLPAKEAKCPYHPTPNRSETTTKVPTTVTDATPSTLPITRTSNSRPGQLIYNKMIGTCAFTDDQPIHNLPDPKSCKKYRPCLYGRLYEARCELGQEYSTLLNQCVPADQARCKVQVRKQGAACPINKESVYTDPYDCRAFYLCTGGRVQHKYCPAGLQFSPINLICMPATTAKCLVSKLWEPASNLLQFLYPKVNLQRNDNTKPKYQDYQLNLFKDGINPDAKRIGIKSDENIDVSDLLNNSERERSNDASDDKRIGFVSDENVDVSDLFNYSERERSSDASKVRQRRSGRGYGRLKYLYYNDELQRVYDSTSASDDYNRFDNSDFKYDDGSYNRK